VLDGDVIKEIREATSEDDESAVGENAGEVVAGPGSSPIIVTP
jgi:hypothetical protein